jgi:hypothetical protein
LKPPKRQAYGTIPSLSSVPITEVFGKGHGGKTLQELETPFIVAGKNVKRIPKFKESMMQFD